MPIVQCATCGRSTEVSFEDLGMGNPPCSYCDADPDHLLADRLHQQPIELWDRPAHLDAVPQPHHDRRRRASGVGFLCPFCGTDLPPRQERRITLAGWYLFVVLLCTVCLSWLCWLPLLLLREEKRVCSQCGIKLG